VNKDGFISDEVLTAYLDGELSEAERADVDAALETNADVQGRLAALDLPLDAVRERLDAVLDMAPPPPELGAPVAAPAWLPKWAGLAAALVLGLGLGGWAMRPAEVDWVEVVANYQSLYVTETLAAPRLPEAEESAKIADLSNSLGIDLSPLTELAPVMFRRAQMLGIEGEPLVQMAYLAGDVPVAICVTPIDGADTGVELDRRFDMEAASWVEGGYGYLVIGGDDRDLIRDVADQVRSAL